MHFLHPSSLVQNVPVQPNMPHQVLVIIFTVHSTAPWQWSHRHCRNHRIKTSAATRLESNCPWRKEALFSSKELHRKGGDFRGTELFSGQMLSLVATPLWPDLSMPSFQITECPLMPVLEGKGRLQIRARKSWQGHRAPGAVKSQSTGWLQILANSIKWACSTIWVLGDKMTQRHLAG